MRELSFTMVSFADFTGHYSLENGALLSDVLQDIMDNHESMDKAIWTREMLHIFCDIYIKAIDMGMRPNTHFNICG
uniref:Uncharacterized protein n=1 Tax=Salix viminalis TaxID=40686 RepID=A0A6N2KAQ1_SALVM